MSGLPPEFEPAHGNLARLLAAEPWRWRKLVFASELAPWIKVGAFGIQDHVWKGPAVGIASYSEIAPTCGLTERGVRGAAAALKKSGFLLVKKTKFNGPNKFWLSLPESLRNVTHVTVGDFTEPSRLCRTKRHECDAPNDTAVSPNLPLPSFLPSKKEEDHEVEEGKSDEKRKVIEFSGIDYSNLIQDDGVWAVDLVPYRGNDDGAAIQIIRRCMMLLGYEAILGTKQRWSDGRYVDQVVREMIPAEALAEMVQRCRAKQLTTGDVARAVKALGIPPATSTQTDEGSQT